MSSDMKEALELTFAVIGGVAAAAFWVMIVLWLVSWAARRTVGRWLGW